MEGNVIEFVVNLNDDGFAVVSKRQLCMFGMFQSLIVMVMKNIVDNNAHLQKVVHIMFGWEWKVDTWSYTVWGIFSPLAFEQGLVILENFFGVITENHL
jgi:hypothetical protein